MNCGGLPGSLCHRDDLPPLPCPIVLSKCGKPSLAEYPESVKRDTTVAAGPCHCEARSAEAIPA